MESQELPIISAPHAHGGILLMEAMLVSEHRASTKKVPRKGGT